VTKNKNKQMKKRLYSQRLRFMCLNDKTGSQENNYKYRLKRGERETSHRYYQFTSATELLKNC
jgi:hypothetical protein